MDVFFLLIFVFLAAVFLLLFIRGPYQHSPLWLMFGVWMMAFGLPRLELSKMELPWTLEYWLLLLVSLGSFAGGFFAAERFFERWQAWKKFSFFQRSSFSVRAVRIAVYLLFAVSLVALYMFYARAGNFPLLAPDSDEFRFYADEQVPGLINYCAQLARLFIPLSFFLMFIQGFKLKKHFDLVLLSLVGAVALTLFASRTQIFFIDLWIMALYLFLRKPDFKQALKFYPVFLLISIVILAAVPLVRQYKSYGAGYLEGVTQIDSSGYLPGARYFLPIYIGVSFNQQALLHAKYYYDSHELQKGKVTLDPFTNILGLDNLKSKYDLGEIFQPWWNTGTYLFPFVQDFGDSAFFFVPAVIAFLLAFSWKLWKSAPSFFSANLYAYGCFFIVMTIYLSFTVRAEMYIDLFLILLISLAVSATPEAKSGQTGLLQAKQDKI